MVLPWASSEFKVQPVVLGPRSETGSRSVSHIHYLIEAKIDAGGDDNLVIYFIWPYTTSSYIYGFMRGAELEVCLCSLIMTKIIILECPVHV